MSENKWDKNISLKTEDILNLAIEWVNENRNGVSNYLYWAKELIERKRGEGNISGDEKALFLIALVFYMKPTYLRSLLMHILDMVIDNE